MKTFIGNVKEKKLEYQVSVSKIFSVATQKMWEFLFAEIGIGIWLGKINLDDLEINKIFKTENGTEGKLTVLVPDCHLRFSWKPIDWEKPSIVELRVKDIKGKSSVLFHHTKFYKLEQKVTLRTHWKAVIAKMEIALNK